MGTPRKEDEGRIQANRAYRSSNWVVLWIIGVCAILPFILNPTLCGRDNEAAGRSEKARRNMPNQLELIMPWHPVCLHGNCGGNRKADSQIQRKRERDPDSGIDEPSPIKPVLPKAGCGQSKRTRGERHVAYIDRDTKEFPQIRYESKQVPKHDAGGPARKIGLHRAGQSFHALPPNLPADWVLCDRFWYPVKGGEVLEPSSGECRYPKNHTGQRRINHCAGTQEIQASINIHGIVTGQIRPFEHQCP